MTHEPGEIESGSGDIQDIDGKNKEVTTRDPLDVSLLSKCGKPLDKAEPSNMKNKTSDTSDKGDWL